MEYEVAWDDEQADPGGIWIVGWRESIDGGRRRHPAGCRYWGWWGSGVSRKGRFFVDTAIDVCCF